MFRRRPYNKNKIISTLNMVFGPISFSLLLFPLFFSLIFITTVSNVKAMNVSNNLLDSMSSGIGNSYINTTASENFSLFHITLIPPKKEQIDGLPAYIELKGGGLINPKILGSVVKNNSIELYLSNKNLIAKIIIYNENMSPFLEGEVELEQEEEEVFLRYVGALNVTFIYPKEEILLIINCGREQVFSNKIKVNVSKTFILPAKRCRLYIPVRDKYFSQYVEIESGKIKNMKINVKPVEIKISKIVYILAMLLVFFVIYFRYKELVGKKMKRKNKRKW